MSRETLTHLNTQTLIGYTSKRGQAWHYRAEHQGAEPNHYEHAVPVADVRRRLFSLVPGRGRRPGGHHRRHRCPDLHRRRRGRRSSGPDTGAILGIFRTGYKVHDYDQWLITQRRRHPGRRPAHRLRRSAAWGSGRLGPGRDGRHPQRRRGRVPAVPDRHHLTGRQHRHHLPDRRPGRGLRQHPLRRPQHRRHPGQGPPLPQQPGQARRRSATRSASCTRSPTTSPPRSSGSPTRPSPTRSGPGSSPPTAAPTTPRPASGPSPPAGSRPTQLDRLWNHDQRVTPWRGTAYGVLAAANTYAHHLAPVRGATRAERNAERLVTGKVHDLDRHTLQVLATV